MLGGVLVVGGSGSTGRPWRPAGVRTLGNLAIAVGVREMAQHSPMGPSGMSQPKTVSSWRPPQIFVEDRREFNQIGHVHTPIRLCRHLAKKQLKASACRITNLSQRYVVQLKAVAHVARNQYLKRRRCPKTNG